MKIICKHNGTILDQYGYDNKTIDDVKELDEPTVARIVEIVRWRATDRYDFEYGIGGFAGDEYYKIKHITFANNDTEILVRVSKVG
jgi:hypothetical protein